MSENQPTSPKKLHPLAKQIPGWLDMLLQNQGLKNEYLDYLQDLLTTYRNKQDGADDLTTFAKLRGAIDVLKEQLSFVSNWNMESQRRNRHEE